jgi:predicted GIY-YIG superfamily endonuclease
MVVYKITNNVNGKTYIGKTSRSLEKRFSEHCSASNTAKMPTAEAIKKSYKGFERII